MATQKILDGSIEFYTPFRKLSGVLVDEIADEIIVLHGFEVLLQQVYVLQGIAIDDVTHAV
jgi:hypothetical protein